MAKQQKEQYYASTTPAAPCCVVAGCAESVVAEVDAGSYGLALEAFRGVIRKTTSRRIGDEHFYACAYHLEHDLRMARLQWQSLMFLMREEG
jgi:hypothetical protein